MLGVATHRVSILRGTETDQYDDEVDSTVPVHTDVLIGFLEVDRRVYLPAEQATRVVRSYEAQVGWEVDLRKDDRIQLADGTVYLVTELSEPTGILGVRPDRVAILSRTT